jgi:hypothetical protein
MMIGRNKSTAEGGSTPTGQKRACRGARWLCHTSIVSATEIPLRFVLLGLRPSADVSQPKWGSNGDVLNKCLCLQQSRMGIHGEESSKSFRNGDQGRGVGVSMDPRYEPGGFLTLRTMAGATRREEQGRNAGDSLCEGNFTAQPKGGYGPQVEMNGKLSRMLHDRRERGT